MDQSENPAEEERYSQDDEEVTDINAGSIGGKEDGEESEDCNQGSTQQRHCRFLADGGKSLRPWFAGGEVNEDTIDYDYGIIDEHTHSEDERSQ